MRENTRLFRLSTGVAIASLFCNAVTPAIAVAQQAPPPPVSSPSQPDQNQGDPPARVGRIASRSGTVSFRTNADTEWSAAGLNYPVSAGNAFWTEPAARAELEISTGRVALAGETEFELNSLDDTALRAAMGQGEAYFHLVNLASDEVWSVQTPRGLVRLAENGRYSIVAGTTEQPTIVTVLEGSAEIVGPGLSLKVAANQSAALSGSDPIESSVASAERDAFVTARLKAERSPARPTASIPAELTYMSGVEDLADYGNWSSDPDYGDVWYPRVSAGWAPYRDGNWAYVAPWGWTWMDAAPWGFAPSHYGRWAHVGGRWGWAPGDRPTHERPVYAPALVAFLGVSAGVAAATVGRSVGWVPLGPREAYRPWYRTSRDYLRRLNDGDAEGAPGGGSLSNFVNRAAATAVPASVLTESRPVRGMARPVPGQAIVSADPVAAGQPIRPTVATIGVTPAVARQLNLVGGTEIGPRRGAPGPVVRVQETGPKGGDPVRPPLPAPRPGTPRGPTPAQPGTPPVAESTRPPGVSLPLPTPGIRPAGVPEPREVRPVLERPATVPPAVTRPRPIFEFNGTPPSPIIRPAGVPEPHEIRRPNEPPAPSEVRPRIDGPNPEPPRRLPSVERPLPEPNRLPLVERPIPVPRMPSPTPEIRQAPSPRIEQGRPVEQSRPSPRVEAPRPIPVRPEGRRPDQR